MMNDGQATRRDEIFSSFARFQNSDFVHELLISVMSTLRQFS